MTAIDAPSEVQKELDADHAASHEQEHPSFLAHHFDSPAQQFEAGKLGMWLFLGTELLLFGGLFCLYAVFRGNKPEIFAYGSQFLDVKWGAINTVVLILSSLTMACAVSAAQLGRRRTLVVLLALTFLGGGGFMGIKYLEYSHKFHEHLVWGTKFYQPPAHPAGHVEAFAVAEEPARREHGDVERGTKLFRETCRSCHGVAGEGIPGQGKDQRGSEFIASKTDWELVEFIKVGRMPFDPLNTTGIQMPPKGGNPLLKDDDLLDIVAYVRTFEGPPAASAEGAAGAQDGTVSADASPDAGTPEEFWIPRSSLPTPPQGPAGLAEARLASLRAGEGEAPPPEAEVAPVHHTVDPHRPVNAHIFFGVYFCMTGLHGLHVLAGMAVIAWLMVRSARGHFGPQYFTPVDLGGLYWHVVDLIWIFLFPLLYLIT